MSSRYFVGVLFFRVEIEKKLLIIILISINTQKRIKKGKAYIIFGKEVILRKY